VDHLAVCQQLSVVVAAIDTRDEAVDASPVVNGIVHDLPGDDDARSASRHPHFARPRALKRPEKADGTVWADVASGEAPCRNGGFAGLSWMARPGLEPGTPRFSDRCSEHSNSGRNALALV
jgi:hypothetical protein